MMGRLHTAPNVGALGASPSPLRGGVRGGGDLFQFGSTQPTPPSPTPSPQGGRGFYVGVPA
jgi:hypothetical protein